MPHLHLKKIISLLALLIIILFLSLNLSTAIEMQLSRQAYDGGETLTARLDADFLSPLSSSDVFFYRGHVLVNMIYDATFSNNTLFIYAITPDNARNYTLLIKNVRYRENGIAKESDISANVSVSSEKADFYATPGFILTESSFNIRVANRKENYTNISLSFQDTRQDVSLPPLGYKIISLSAKNINSFTIANLFLEGEKTSYSFPVLIYPTASTATPTTGANETASANETNISANVSASNYTNETGVSANASSNASQETNNGNASMPYAEEYQAQEALKFSPESITELSLIYEQLPLALPLSLMNLHTEIISDISLSYDKSLEGIIYLAQGFIESIEPASSQQIEMIIKNITKQGFFNGTIRAESASGNFSAVFYLEIEITKDYSNLGSLEIATEEACNLDYETICQPEEFCTNLTEGMQRHTSEGICCPEGGKCQKPAEEKPKSSGSGKVIGFSILFAVIIIAILLFMKFKKVKKKEIADIYEKAEEKYMKEPKI